MLEIRAEGPMTNESPQNLDEKKTNLCHQEKKLFCNSGNIGIYKK
jgi:hypothetical protein